MYISKEDREIYLSSPTTGEFDIPNYHIEVKDIITDQLGTEYVICCTGQTVFGSVIYSDEGREYILVSANKIWIDEISSVCT